MKNLKALSMKAAEFGTLVAKIIAFCILLFSLLRLSLGLLGVWPGLELTTTLSDIAGAVFILICVWVAEKHHRENPGA